MIINIQNYIATSHSLMFHFDDVMFHLIHILIPSVWADGISKKF